MDSNLKEMLRLAAKAAGYTGEVFFSGVTEECLFAFDMDTAKRTGRTKWAPHEDDGDSRRLEVALGLTVDVRPLCVCIFQGKRQFSSFGKADQETDMCGAARRAVLHAAAEIGRAMP